MTAKTQEAFGPHSEIAITPAQLMLTLAALFLLNLLLRVFYLRYDFVNGDEGVRALTAVRMLEGARLYADVVTDKPPGASLFYAAVFAVFGRSMKAVHLAAIVWNFATSVVVYLIAARFYNKRAALWAALLFVYFSTNYFTQDMMAANTELLMALPYAASFLFFMSAHDVGLNPPRGIWGTRGALLIAGALTGVAVLFKQVGVLNLGFFAIYESFRLWSTRRGDDQAREWTRSQILGPIGRLFLVGTGFIIVIAGFVLWLKSMGALADFWRNAVVLNMFYIDSEPMDLWVKFGFGRGLGYVFFNGTLWLLGGWAVARSLRSLRVSDAADEEGKRARMDLTSAGWACVSLVGVAISGRFYGHYFIPSLPALCLLGAGGVGLLAAAGGHRARRGMAALALLFLIGLVRCHHRTAVLAYETLTGTRTRWSADWGMTKRQDEAAIIAAYVRERIPPGQPLYIWGYAHDVFWQSGCRPASRYLAPYYIDGRFSDAEAAPPASAERFRIQAAANLLQDLRREKPRLILDAGGGFKNLPNAELVEFVERAYRDLGNIRPDPSQPFRVFERIDPPVD